MYLSRYILSLADISQGFMCLLVL